LDHLVGVAYGNLEPVLLLLLGLSRLSLNHLAFNNDALLLTDLTELVGLLLLLDALALNLGGWLLELVEGRLGGVV